MQKLSNFIVKFLEKEGIKDVFMISGGLSMHLNNSFGASKKIKYYCNFHEQASAMAAEAYAKLKGKLAVCVVTGGPGGSNTITGVVGQWQDSVPVLYISGQVKTDSSSGKTKLRQLGEQELNIVELVKPITKYAVRITNAKKIKYHLEKAIYLAKSGRPGPVWLDIPLDIQAAQIDKKSLAGFKPKKTPNYKCSSRDIANLINLINKSKRPVILAGNGIRIAGAYEEFLRLVNSLRIPTLTASCANDLMYAKNKFYFGNPGIIGDRSANFVVQNSDLIISIGSRLNFKTIGFNYKGFARKAKLVVIDIDKNELNKKIIKPYLKINSDAKKFIQALSKQLKKIKIKLFPLWLEKCRDWKNKFPKLLPEYKKNGNKYVNPYLFVNRLSSFFKPGDVFVSCNGTAAITALLMTELKKDQRMILNIGCGAMGYDLPAAIGACIAKNKKPVTLTVGDGSIQFNLQELQTIKTYQLPIKIFVYDNKGYLSVRNTQKKFLKNRCVAADCHSGVSCPDILKLAKAYGLATVKINNHKDLDLKIKKVYSMKGPVVCNVNMAPELEIIPRIESKLLPSGKIVSRCLEDMYPYLNPKELKENMVIKPPEYNE